MPKKPFNLYSVVKTDNPKFQAYRGMPQMSYSAYTSWTNPKYIGEFIAQKFLGISLPSGIFADYGTACGEFIELNGEMPTDPDSIRCRELLSESDIKYLKLVERPEDSEFEREILLNRGKYCVIGYIDRCTTLADLKLHVRDYKTGSTAKAAEYGSLKYQQTNLYAYALESEGEEVAQCDVELLHRKGNTVDPDSHNRLRLVGTSEIIDTPYTKERAEKFLKEMDKVAQEIADYAFFMNKYFGYEYVKLEENGE